MNVGVPRETRDGENRVAATPDSTKRLIGLGLGVLVERGAGETARFPDSEYEAAGAKIVSAEEACGADLVLRVGPPEHTDIAKLRSGSVFISMLDPLGEGKTTLPELAKQGVNAVAMELIPRITRAQSMDVLSSQANLAGYRAVIEATHHFTKFVPMMMTAAGSTPQARVFVLGAGVAGLQAIATARRLGAQVEAYDVRPQVREEIMSLGAKFLDVQLEESGAGEGGYAKELTKDSQAALVAGLAKQLPRADVVISTAQIPGKPAPVLIDEEGVKAMKPGSVIVDMAAGTGGNCTLSEANDVVTKHGVTIIGYTDYPSRMAHHASQFFARNLVNLLKTMVKKDENGPAQIELDFEDEVVEAAMVTRDGQVVWPDAPPKPATSPSPQTVG